MEYIIYTILGYLTVSVIYNTIFSIASVFKTRQTPTIEHEKENRIAAFIPAYKEDGIIFQTAKNALNQDYNPNQYDVIVIADSLQKSTMEKLGTLPIKVMEVAFAKSTKAKAINRTYEAIDTEYDITVVLDADNEMASDFLTKVNREYNAGYRAIQGHRVAKNRENSLSILDTISEEINNNIYRKGHQNLGLSSALIGSGMAFDFLLFRKEMSQIDAIGGFDKALELSLLKSNIAIKYMEDGLVYDEKVSQADVFTNQRTRWIAAQIRYGMNSFVDAGIELFKNGNINYFDKSLQFLLPPRLILLGVLLLTAFGSLLVSYEAAAYVFTLFSVYSLSLIVATPRALFNRESLKACLLLPKTFVLMLIAIAGFKKAKNNFLHTPHQTVQS
ncbi:MAG: glycosyltransferase family 2 protein [Cyclobacteriaceae bacterium]